MSMIVLGKVRKTVTLDAETTETAINVAQFHGYGSLSALLNHLLNRWVKNPEKKEATEQ